MKFRKYNSLINEYRNADIQYWLDKYPHLMDAYYLLTEKIDGANFSVSYWNGKEINFGKRNSYIGNNGSFFNYQEAIDNDNFKDMNKDLKTLSSLKSDTIITAYGELYGNGVQKRIYYGPGKYVKFYDILEGNHYWSVPGARDFFQQFDIFVPVIATVKGFENAITYKNDFVSTLTPEDWKGNKENNIAEGFVMKFIGKDIMNDVGSRFVIKSKNELFKDGTKKKEKREFKEMEGSLRTLLNLAKEYVNENRLLDLISKMGPLTEPKQIGPYMKAFSQDWQDDFRKDYAEELTMASMKYNNSDVKDIFKIAGKNAINLVKDHLNKNNEEARNNMFK